MTALTRLGLMHGNGTQAWSWRPAVEFAVDDRAVLDRAVDDAGDPVRVTIASRLSSVRYVVRFAGGSEMIVPAHMLSKAPS